MPAGVSWNQYLRFVTASLLTMFAGAQTVHIFYRPLDVSFVTKMSTAVSEMTIAVTPGPGETCLKPCEIVL